MEGQRVFLTKDILVSKISVHLQHNFEDIRSLARTCKQWYMWITPTIQYQIIAAVAASDKDWVKAAASLAESNDIDLHKVLLQHALIHCNENDFNQMKEIIVDKVMSRGDNALTKKIMYMWYADQVFLFPLHYALKYDNAEMFLFCRKLSEHPSIVTKETYEIAVKYEAVQCLTVAWNHPDLFRIYTRNNRNALQWTKNVWYDAMDWCKTSVIRWCLETFPYSYDFPTFEYKRVLHPQHQYYDNDDHNNEFGDLFSSPVVAVNCMIAYLLQDTHIMDKLGEAIVRCDPDLGTLDFARVARSPYVWEGVLSCLPRALLEKINIEYYNRYFYDPDGAKINLFAKNEQVYYNILKKKRQKQG